MRKISGQSVVEQPEAYRALALCARNYSIFLFRLIRKPKCLGSRTQNRAMVLLTDALNQKHTNSVLGGHFWCLRIITTSQMMRTKVFK